MADDRAKNRPKRKPVGTRKALVSADRPGYVRRYVNDVGSRLQDFLDAGYTLVQDNTANLGERDASKSSTHTARVSVGQDVNAVLMEIPVEFYNEDQELKKDKIRQIESTYDPEKSNQPGSYGGKLTQTKT